MLEVYRLSVNDELFAEVRAVRSKVFVIEQGVSESDEYDTYEDEAKHYLIQKDIKCENF